MHVFQKSAKHNIHFFLKKQNSFVSLPIEQWKRFGNGKGNGAFLDNKEA